MRCLIFLDSFWIHTHMLRSTTNHTICQVRRMPSYICWSVPRLGGWENVPNGSDLKNQIMNMKLYQIISKYCISKLSSCINLFSFWCVSSYVSHPYQSALTSRYFLQRCKDTFGWDCICQTDANVELLSLIELHRSDFVVTELCHAGQAWCPEGLPNDILALFWEAKAMESISTPRPSQYYFGPTWILSDTHNEQIEPANSSKCKHLISAMIISATLREERVKIKEISRSMNARGATQSSP